MNLLDTASLVVTPNGYKASKLYSIVPSDGTGDMTFARTGDTATRVNSSGLIESVTANKPRLDYLGSTCPKLLLEPQRTNLLTYSSAFDNADWTKSNVTITANDTVSPDGTTNAEKFTYSTASGAVVYKIFSISSGSYSLSCFFKAGTGNSGKLQIYDTVNGSTIATYNLTAGTSTITTGTGTTKIELISNGWYRCSLSVTGTSGSIYTFIGFDLTSGQNAYAYGAQLEAGAYATSYIPTTTATVTRNADSCSKTGITSLIGQTEGTIFLDLNLNGLNSSNFNRFFSLSASDWSVNSIRIEYGTTANKISVTAVASSSGTFNFATPNTYSLNTRLKIALAYKANDVVLYVNGIQTNSITSTGAIPACSVIALNELYLFGTGGERSNFTTTALWKTRLTNQELVTLTTI